jgi:hypothetical protein
MEDKVPSCEPTCIVGGDMLAFYLIAGGIGAAVFFILVLSLPFRKAATKKAAEKTSSPRNLIFAYGAIFLFVLPLAIHRFVTGETEDKVLVSVIIVAAAVGIGLLIRADIKLHRGRNKKAP